MNKNTNKETDQTDIHADIVADIVVVDVQEKHVDKIQTFDNRKKISNASMRFL